MRRQSRVMNNPEMPEHGELELVARTLSIHERVSGLPEAAAPESDARVAAWARQVSPDRFRLRLSWLGLEEDDAKRVASDPVPPAAPPVWFEIAEQVRAHLCDAPAPERVEVAFGEYWQAWGAVARARLACDLPEPILAELERGLVSELSSLGSSCLMSAFDAHRLPWQLGPGQLIARLSSTPPTTLYQSFVRELCTGPMAWARFPSLVRLAATRVACWVDAVTEFTQRLEADRPALSLRVGRDLGPLTSLRDRVSDSHNGGRRVFLLGFGDDIELVYKPRSVRSELALQEIVAWTNEHSPGAPRLEHYWVLERDGYGWTELVKPAPCPESEAASYYERAGMLLGLAYILVGSDCHEGNVIAHGACPMLVDLETFAGPQLLPLEADAPEYAEAMAQLETESVLAIGLLPGWTWSRPGAAEASGFAGEGKGRLFRFAHLNTDLMRLVRIEDHLSAPAANQPRLASGVAIEADAHVDSIVKGFERLYTLARAHRDELLRPDGPLANLRRGLARVVFRDTAQYAQVLGASLKPRAMEDGFARSVTLERLAPMLMELEPTPDWAAAVLGEEQDALFRGDIPLFLVDRFERFPGRAQPGPPSRPGDWAHARGRRRHPAAGSAIAATRPRRFSPAAPMHRIRVHRTRHERESRPDAELRARTTSLSPASRSWR